METTCTDVCKTFFHVTRRGAVCLNHASATRNYELHGVPTYFVRQKTFVTVPQHNQIGALSNFDRAAIAQPKHRRRVHGSSGNRLSWRQPRVTHRQRNDEGHRVRRCRGYTVIARERK